MIQELLADLNSPTLKKKAMSAVLLRNFDRFKTSELKAILQIVPQLFSTHKLDFLSSQDKEKALQIFGQIET